MYTTDIQDSGTVSATDEERLPPGGFSLRHGFPGWFGRASRRSAERVRNVSGTSGMQTPAKGRDVGSPGSGSGGSSGLGIMMSGGSTPGPGRRGPEIATFEVLRYIRSAFDDEEVLDNVPLEAAGNPGAWHAWRSQRARSGKVSPVSERAPGRDGMGEDVPKAMQVGSPSVALRKPGEWNWDGVWEVRVKKGIDASLAEAVLYGKDVGDDLIRFLNLDADQMEAVKADIRKSLEINEPQRRGIV